MWRVYVPTAIAVTILTWLHGYGTGRNLEGQEFAEYRAKIEVEMAELERKNEEQRRHYDKVSKDAAAGYEAAIAAHSRGSGRIRVQQCPRHRAEVPAPAATTGGAGEAATERRPDTGRDEAVSVERCEEIANRAVMDAAQVLHLQSWYQSIKTEGE